MKDTSKYTGNKNEYMSFSGRLHLIQMGFPRD